MKSKTLFPYSVFLVLSGCQLLAETGPRAPVVEPQTYSLDGVKYIAPEITDGNAAVSYSQTSYLISNTGRLLLRFESLSQKVSEVSLAENRRVSVDISIPANEDADAAEASFQVCPLTKNWMMLATWSRAYPMPGGSWNQDGGDYDADGCILDELVPLKAAKSDTSLRVLRFDVTPWFVDYVKGRGINYGLVLLSTNGAAAKVVGDASGGNSPRISWLFTHY